MIWTHEGKNISYNSCTNGKHSLSWETTCSHIRNADAAFSVAENAQGRTYWEKKSAIEDLTDGTSVKITDLLRLFFQYIESLGGKAVMTSNQHERASDRCAEALIILEENQNVHYDIVVMVQGDEPMTHPNMINEALQPMIEDEKILVTNLFGQINGDDEFENRYCIKVVCDLQSNDLFFTRETIPTRSKSNKVQFGKQV